MTNAVLDKETFCRLVEEHQSALYRTARSILSNQQDAEDAVQEPSARPTPIWTACGSRKNSNPGSCGSWSTSAMTSAAGSGGPWTSTRRRNT